MALYQPQCCAWLLLGALRAHTWVRPYSREQQCRSVRHPRLEPGVGNALSLLVDKFGGFFNGMDEGGD
jgi:hypothetical protein